MKASLEMIYLKEKEFINEQLEKFIKEIEKVAKEKEKEFLNEQVDKFMKASLEMTKEKEKE